MAARHLFRRSTAPVVAGLLSAGVILYPRDALAESPESEAIVIPKKPIYDDPHSMPDRDHPSPTSSASPKDRSSKSTSESTPQPAPVDPTPTYTDRLASQIRRARLSLYSRSAAGETHMNDYLTRALHLESSLFNTVASLAPPPTAHEPLLPGFAYTLVSMLAGSILTRNRGILLRFSVPLAFGVVAAEATLPATMRNVGDLIWRWEERYPELARQHIVVRERVEQFWETGKSHALSTGDFIEEKADEARKGVEDWVKKGK